MDPLNKKWIVVIMANIAGAKSAKVNIKTPVNSAIPSKPIITRDGNVLPE